MMRSSDHPDAAMAEQNKKAQADLVAEILADAAAEQKRRREVEANKQAETKKGYQSAFSEQANQSKQKRKEVIVLEQFARKQQKSKSEGVTEQQTKGNGAGPNFTFKEAPNEEPKGDADEAAVRAEAPAAVNELGVAEAKRRYVVRRLKLEEINRRCAVIRSFGGKCVVVTEGRSPIFQSREAFEQWKANDFIPSLKKRNESEPVGPWWWRHPRRRQYDGVVFKPLAPPVVQSSDGQLLFNTYLGWGVKPKQGDWSLMQQ